MATPRSVAALGYTVSVAAAGVSLVTGYGVETYVRDDDAATWAALADPAAHAERVKQSADGPPLPPVTADVSPFAAMAALDPKTATVADIIGAAKAAAA